MGRRIGKVEEYKGPEDMYDKRLKQKLADARFMTKYMSCIEDPDFKISIVIEEKQTGQKHIYIPQHRIGKEIS
jgi:hypothetical protein